MASVFATDKTAKDGETKRWFVESTADWQMADAVAKHITERVDGARWSVKPEYSAHNGEPTWDAAKYMKETPQEWPEGEG